MFNKTKHVLILEAMIENQKELFFVAKTDLHIEVEGIEGRQIQLELLEFSELENNLTRAGFEQDEAEKAIQNIATFGATHEGDEAKSPYLCNYYTEQSPAEIAANLKIKTLHIELK